MLTLIDLFLGNILRTFSESISLVKFISMWSNNTFENLLLVIQFSDHIFIRLMIENDRSREVELTEIIRATCISLYKLGKHFSLILDTTSSMSKSSFQYNFS